MKRIITWFACLLFIIGQPQVLRADDFNPDLPTEPNTQYIVSVAADPAEGAYSLSGAGQYSPGSSITVSQSAYTGYHFEHWTRNGLYYSSEASFNYTVNGNVSFVAHYTLEPKIGVTVRSNDESQGTVDGAGAYSQGEQIVITATPNTAEGYTFDYWTQDGEYFGNSLSFEYTVESEPTEFVAYFAYAEFNPQTPNEPSTKLPVTVTADPEGVAILTGGGLYSRGTEVDIAVDAPSNYRFNHWTLNGVRTDYPASFIYTVGNEPAYFVAVLDYLQTVSVSANPLDAGWTEGSGYYDIGQLVSINAGGYDPYEFAYYTINGYRLDTTQSFTYTVGDSSVFIVANFRNTTAFDPQTPVEPIIYVRISATPPENYYFVSWNDGNTDNPRMVPANKVDEYEPIFAPIDFEITEYATICANEYYMLGDNRLTVPGAYRATLVSSLGSDSVVTLLLSVNPSYFFSTVEVLEEDREIVFLDKIITTPGIYQWNFKTELGCDSIYQLQVVLPEDIVPDQPIYYNVRFVDWDGTLLKVESVEEGKDATAPEVPTREGYTFIGWDTDFTNVHSDLTVTALYEENEQPPLPEEPIYYTVRFYDWDGTLLKVESVEEGKDATPPDDPYRKGYRFIGWDEDYTNVRRNLNIYAQYRKREEGLDDVQENIPCTKILRDGQVLILRGEKVYTVTGQEVR